MQHEELTLCSFDKPFIGYDCWDDPYPNFVSSVADEEEEEYDVDEYMVILRAGQDRKQERITSYFKDKITVGEKLLWKEQNPGKSTKRGADMPPRSKVEKPIDRKHQRLSPELGEQKSLLRYLPKLSLLRSSAGEAADEWTYCHDERVLFTTNGTYLY